GKLFFYDSASLFNDVFEFDFEISSNDEAGKEGKPGKFVKGLLAILDSTVRPKSTRKRRNQQLSDTSLKSSGGRTILEGNIAIPAAKGTFPAAIILNKDSPDSKLIESYITSGTRDSLTWVEGKSLSSFPGFQNAQPISSPVTPAYPKSSLPFLY
ncbi:MAG: hypothetical protein K2H64_07265, partial [Desulfovibrio sp.]|nr:hypothetical protein [Desulfovibrio sp.]